MIESRLYASHGSKPDSVVVFSESCKGTTHGKPSDCRWRNPADNGGAILSIRRTVFAPAADAT